MNRGFTLIEILVGMFIGVLIAMAATTSLSLFQSSSRTSNSGNSAITDGINALYNLEHDIKMAGLGLVINQSVPCAKLNAKYNGNTVANNKAIAPMVVNSPGGSAPDSITVFYGNSVMAGAPLRIVNNVGSTLTLDYMSTMSASDGDYALIATINNPAACSLVTISNITNNSVQYNAGGLAVTVSPPDSYFVLLKTLNWYTWQIINNSLVVTDNLSQTNSIVADNIVQLVTQYGVTNGVSNAINQWVYPSDPSGLWSTPDQAHLQMIRAIRVAIIARSAQKEKPTGGGNVCNTTANAPIPWQGANAVDLSADADWQCYRYHVFQTVIPVKNLIAGIN